MEEIFVNNIYDQGLIFRTYKEFLQFNNKNIAQMKMDKGFE